MKNDNKPKRSKKWYILYTLGIFSLAPLTLLILYGLGSMVSMFANPSAIGPGLILVLVVIPIGLLYPIGWYLKRNDRNKLALQMAKREPAE